MEGVAKLVGTFGAGRVIIEGHTDSSLRGQMPVDAVKELSMNRANAVKEALVAKYKMQPEPPSRATAWAGIVRPIRKEPLDQAKNRRVEIKVYPAEKQ